MTAAGRPSVSVVMPFAGDAAAARAALSTLAALQVGAGDQRILADNAGSALLLAAPDGVEVLDAGGERSPAHARNAGAARARGEWILFLDADCVAPADLLERYFLEPAASEVGALAGEVLPADGAGSVAERYGAARSFLSQRAHLAHRYLPRAAAANLLVRRAAFAAVGGFYEGLRAAEDTDFAWRLQQAGWRLELRGAAHVEHRYRTSIGDLRRQWRGYAAGRAWLARRYPAFTPEPAAQRALRRARRLARRGGRGRPGFALTRRPPANRRDRVAFLALDALLAGEELTGLVLSNRPGSSAAAEASASVVLVAERFPIPRDPLVDFALSLDRARVEAAARPDQLEPAAAGLRIDYREDDGIAARALASLRLIARHPIRCVGDHWRRRGHPGAPTLTALAPAAARLARESGARVHPLGGGGARLTARRLAALAGARHD